MRIGVYVCKCGVNIDGTVDVEAVAEAAASLPFVAISRHNTYTCSDPGQAQIKSDIEELKLDRVVVASCSPRMHLRTFRRTAQEAGLNPYVVEMANIREQCSWVHLDSVDTTRKALSLVAAAVEKAAHLSPLDRETVGVTDRALVIGGGIAGIQAALDIAEAGYKTYLVERQPTIGGKMVLLDKTFPTLDCSACILTPKMVDVSRHPNIELITCAEVEAVEGFVGNFRARIRKQASYVVEKDCTSCSDCTKHCPVEVTSEWEMGLTGATRKAIYRPFPQAVPNTFVIDRADMPPCQSACPIHQNAQGYITMVREGNLEQAAKVTLRDNPLPSICGRVCTHPCTEVCTRADIDEPLNMPGLKRFVMDQAGDYTLLRPDPDDERKEHVAIVGSGPAGLMCAHQLRQRGYRTTIYEAQPVAGGMLRLGIPDFRLPPAVLEAEIDRLRNTGIDIRLNTRIGADTSLQQLRTDHDAVFIAVGAQLERKLGVAGEDLDGVRGGIEFLKQVNLDGEDKIELGDEVLVIGGGNSALDAARTARRMGARVTIGYRRTRAEMPVDPVEADEARQEGIRMHFLAAPTEILGDDGGRVEGLMCQRMELGPPDESGRRRPVPLEGEDARFRLDCTDIIVTIGQSPDLTGLDDDQGLATTRWDTLEADPVTLQTALPDVFAGGDCQWGADVIITAMMAGKRAAESIHRHLSGLDLHGGREREGPYTSSVNVDTSGFDHQAQVALPHIPLKRRLGTFDEVSPGYSLEQAKAEATRCLNCSVCCDCRLCDDDCEPKCIDHEMEDEVMDLEVGALVVATGFDQFDPSVIEEYRFGKVPDVITSLQFERMVNAGGPTAGRIVCADGTEPRSVGIVHCVGSRDVNHHEYCSKVCCMAALKLAHIVVERTEAECYDFYIDIRSAGKGYEEFYKRDLHEGVRFIRGKVAEVEMSDSADSNLMVTVEDTLKGELRHIGVDLLVLMAAFEPPRGTEELAQRLRVPLSSDGFYLESHPKLEPLETATAGIFLAGACQTPRDIPDSVSQASGAAAKVIQLLAKDHILAEAEVARVNLRICRGCGFCVEACPAGSIELVEQGLEGVMVSGAKVNPAICKGCGVCAAACHSGAITQLGYTDEQLLSQVKALTLEFPSFDNRRTPKQASSGESKEAA